MEKLDGYDLEKDVSKVLSNKDAVKFIEDLTWLNIGGENAK